MTDIMRVGLTGSIGMGKSTTAAMFAALGAAVHDADATVHDLYRQTDIVSHIEAIFGDVTDQNGHIDRAKLGAKVIGHPDAMAALEAIIHPLVHEREAAAIAMAQQAGRPYIVLDIPLLFETGGDVRCDRIIVVTASADIQKARVMARPGMTAQRFAAIVAKQLPDAEKRQKADFIIDTGAGLDKAREAVHAVHQELLRQTAKSG